MGRRSQSGTLIASAVLLAYLALTGQPRAQFGHSSAVAPATQTKSIFGQDLTGLIARVHWILITDTGRAGSSPLNLDAAIANTPTPDRASASAAFAIDFFRPGLYSNKPWMSTSRAWAS
jgi:hypothetical protein